jgi:NADH-quinone oxidoreductase subunit H
MIILPIILTLLFALVTIPLLVWMERRVASLIQDRLGPNRANIKGFHLAGVIQPITDMIKLVFKEELYPKHIKKRIIYILAPGLVYGASLLSFMVVPYADDITLNGYTYQIQGLPIDLGILWFFAISGLAIYGILLAGWASHNKYSILGSLRAGSQMVSYEIAMGLAIVSFLITYDSISLNVMAQKQGELLFGFIPAWGIVLQPLASLIFIVTAFAETNRAPFAVAEGESEIVAGYHTEYSAMKFALFFMGEYMAMSASAAIIVTLVFGGYQIPWLNTATMHEHINPILLGLMLIIPLMSFGFVKWMKKNNSSDANHIKETKYATVFIAFFVVFIVTLLAYLYFTGMSYEQGSVTIMILQIITFSVKVMLMKFVFVCVRWTLPSFRYDQIQHLGWRILLPLALLNIFITATVVIVGGL